MENVIQSALIRIPVKNLVLSPLNVRKKQGSGIEDLAALIASQGLIHNLVVTEQTKKGRKTGRYEVVAGIDDHRRTRPADSPTFKVSY